MLHMDALFPLSDLRETMFLSPELCNAWTDLATDPTSGVPSIASLALAQVAIVAERHRPGLDLPETALTTERAAQMASTNGFTALLEGRATEAAEHFHLLASIEHNQNPDSPHVINAMGLRAYAMLQSGNAIGAAAAQRQWAMVRFAHERQPGGTRRRGPLRARAILLAETAEQIAAAKVGDRGVLLVTAQQALVQAQGVLRSLGSQQEGIARLQHRIETLQGEVIALANQQNETHTATPPDPEASDRLLEVAAAVRPVAAGPIGEAAVGAARYFLLREFDVVERDTALALWETAFFARYPDTHAWRDQVGQKRQARFPADFVTELLCYALIPQSLRPYMNAAVATHAEFLRALHDTLEMTPLAVAEDDDAAMLHRLATILRLLREVARSYQRGGYTDGVARLEHLETPLQELHQTLSDRLGMEAYHAGTPAAIRPWLTAHLIVHPDDATIHAGLKLGQQLIFERSVLAEAMGQHLRMTTDLDQLQAAYRALRHACMGFLRLNLQERARAVARRIGDLEHEFVEAGAPHLVGASKPSGVGTRASRAGTRGSSARARGEDDAATRDAMSKAMADLLAEVNGSNTKKT